MNLYLVRHGETDANVNTIHQHSGTELSDVGKDQARKLGKRLKELSIEAFISSSSTRAVQTAGIVSKEIGLIPEISDLFTEVKKPSILIGKSYKDRYVEDIKQKVLDNWSNPDFRHSDEETFLEFRERARQAIDYIKGHNVKNLLVISHGEYIKLLVCIMLLEETFTPEIFVHMRRNLYLRNTGITELNYSENKWQLIFWNDFSHLI